MVNLAKLKEEQTKLARKVILKDDFEEANTFGGADCAFFGNKIVAAITVCDKNMNIIDKQYSFMDARIPYNPGFVFYREGPALADAYSKLTIRPDILMMEGDGILHPLNIGIASQFGVLQDQATIGIAKSLALGNVEDEKVLVGNEVRGMELRTKEHGNPIYISPGHKISLKTSVELVKNTLRPPHKLPEPLHLAHRYADKIKDEKEKLTGI